MQSVRSASICSVICIVPNSAARAEPDLPHTMIAVSTGPSSRVIPHATMTPSISWPPMRLSPAYDCKARAKPEESVLSMIMVEESTPIRFICIKSCLPRSRVVNKVFTVLIKKNAQDPNSVKKWINQEPTRAKIYTSVLASLY